MQHDFKVGDIIQFKDWNEMAEEYDSDNDRIYFGDPDIHHTFIDEMKHLCGTTAVIKEFVKSNPLYVYLKDFTAKERTSWIYHVYMFKPVSATAPPPPTLPWDEIFYNKQ